MVAVSVIEHSAVYSFDPLTISVPSAAHGPSVKIVAALEACVEALVALKIDTPLVQADVDACVTLMVSIILVRPPKCTPQQRVRSHSNILRAEHPSWPQTLDPVTHPRRLH